MKRFIIQLSQLKEYVENKQADRIFYEIVESLHKNSKFLNESISHRKVNQSVINDYRRKNLITPKVHEMLVKSKIIDENYQII